MRPPKKYVELGERFDVLFESVSSLAIAMGEPAIHFLHG